MQECNLQRAYLSQCRLQKTQWTHCDLRLANLFQTSLKGMDLSTCELEGFLVSDTFAELAGAKISALQALEVVRLLGLEVV